MIQLPLDSPPITGQPYLLREMWDSHMSYTTWPSFTCDHKCSPGPVKLVQFVDVPIFQPWPTLQFVLLAPISHLGQPFWFIYSCKYFFFLLQLNFREEEFSHDTVLWESLHTDEWYWKRWGGKVTAGLSVEGCKDCTMLARVTSRLPQQRIMKPKGECDGEERCCSSRFTHFSSLAL